MLAGDVPIATPFPQRQVTLIELHYTRTRFSCTDQIWWDVWGAPPREFVQEGEVYKAPASHHTTSTHSQHDATLTLQKSRTAKKARCPHHVSRNFEAHCSPHPELNPTCRPFLLIDKNCTAVQRDFCSLACAPFAILSETYATQSSQPPPTQGMKDSSEHTMKVKSSPVANKDAKQKTCRCEVRWKGWQKWEHSPQSTGGLPAISQNVSRPPA